jgi:NAD(P)-dependent dehydrogenase (short-subunit alcohol dehydrogenase family)
VTGLLGGVVGGVLGVLGGGGPEPRRDRTDQVVVVTGASSGIGLATALLLAADGARLVLASRGTEALRRAEASCVEAGGQVTTVPTDVRDPDAVKVLFAEAVERFGRVDAVVHAAGVLAYGRFEDVPADVFEQVIATNVLGTGHIARAALDVFRDQGHGNLVVLGSVVGKIATSMMSNYQTSKWGVHGLVRALQVEVRETPGVHVTLVAPGGVDTPIYTQAGNYSGWEGRPPPPVYRPETVARAVVRGLDHPQREISVGFANSVMVFGFRALPWAYEAMVTPLMRALAMSSRPVPPGPGNVEGPREEGEQLRGEWLPHRLTEVVGLLAGRQGENDSD